MFSHTCGVLALFIDTGQLLLRRAILQLDSPLFPFLSHKPPSIRTALVFTSCHVCKRPAPLFHVPTGD
ncbi:hypothetical protein Hanom_Chr14g01277671 [Helianthus anomalus]